MACLTPNGTLSLNLVSSKKNKIIFFHYLEVDYLTLQFQYNSDLRISAACRDKKGKYLSRLKQGIDVNRTFFIKWRVT